MSTSPITIGADFPAQVARVRALIAETEALPGMQLTVFLMRGQLAQALADWESGDVVAITRSYETLRGWR